MAGAETSSARGFLKHTLRTAMKKNLTQRRKGAEGMGLARKDMSFRRAGLGILLAKRRNVSDFSERIAWKNTRRFFKNASFDEHCQTSRNRRRAATAKRA